MEQSKSMDTGLVYDAGDCLVIPVCARTLVKKLCVLEIPLDKKHTTTVTYCCVQTSVKLGELNLAAMEFKWAD